MNVENMNVDLKTVWDSTSLRSWILIEMHCIVKWWQGVDLLFNSGLMYFLPPA